MIKLKHKRKFWGKFEINKMQMAQIEYAINIGGSKGKLIMPFQNAAQQHGLKCQRSKIFGPN